jgi:ABC-type Zn uptake system ZnuABC Zn-binding protein ZnuA
MRILLCLICAGIALAAEPLRVCAAEPEIGAIVRAVGGDEVVVTVFASPGEDPHRVEARPSFIVELARADLLIATGFELEVGWLPPLIDNARNPAIRRNRASGKTATDQPGYFEACLVVQRPIGIPEGVVDRSAGDVHPHGNPHFLLDPVNGMLLSEAVRERLTWLRPESAAAFAGRATAFRARLGTALFGADLVRELDPLKLAMLLLHDRLGEFLKQQGLEARLGGWLAQMAPFVQAQIAADHDLYPYFARRFNLRTSVLLEPKPGVPPSTRHLAEIAARMKAQKIKALLATPYFDRKAIDLVANSAGANVAAMAHQAGSLPGTEDYVDWIAANVNAVQAALAR